MILSNYPNTHNGCWWLIEIFFADSKVSHHIHKISLFLTILGDFSENPLKTSKKHKKLLSAHVCSHIMRLGRRTMLPFALGDRYGSKQACKHQQRMLVAGRKILRTTQRQTSRSQTHKFWGFQTTQSQKLPLSGYQIWKMAISLRLCLYNLIEVSCDASVSFGK